MEIHVWRPIDSQFRLITARRNPNMVILVAALLFPRPDVGLELVALWTLVSLIFHAVRLAQATERAARGEMSSPGSKREFYRRRARRLAAGRDPFAEQFGTDMKALIPVGGEPMVRRPVRALLASQRIGQVDRARPAARPDCRRASGRPRMSVRASRGTIAETMLELCRRPGPHGRCW